MRFDKILEFEKPIKNSLNIYSYFGSKLVPGNPRTFKLSLLYNNVTFPGNLLSCIIEF